jgi:hypothetical protein
VISDGDFDFRAPLRTLDPVAPVQIFRRAA